MNKQLIQAIMYGHILAAQTKGAGKHAATVPLPTANLIPGDEVPSIQLPDLALYKEIKVLPPLNQDEMLEVIVNTLSDVLKLYTSTTLPIGVTTLPGAPIVATLQNLIP